MNKIRVAVLFGGRSTEHEVSLTSALGVLKQIDLRKYDVIPIKITKGGQWQMITDGPLPDSVEFLNNAEGPTVFAGDPDIKGFFCPNAPRKKDGNDPNHVPVDVVFPILHGSFGEDGTMQGFLSLANIPFVGAGVLSSALGMDKIMMKQVFLQADLPITDFMWFLRKKWRSSSDVIQVGVEKEIGCPCFVKPANTGSSVGVFKVRNKEEISSFIDQAAEYDRKILVEKAVDARELECSVLGNDEPEASLVGEIIPCREFYDYEAKYLLDGSRVVIPADIPRTISEEVKRLAVEAFKAIDCAGMARVDFFLERGTDRIFVNEINTIPGFTPISMYPKLWEASGVSYPELIDRLIELALERHKDLNRSKFRRM